MAKNKLLRMDNVGIVVESLDEAISFFAELGLKLEGRATIEGEWAGRVTGLGNQRVEIRRLIGDLGKDRTIVIRPTGSIIAPPMPCRILQATSTWMSRDNPHSSDPSVKTPIAEANTRRVPKRSAIHPLTGMNTARLSV